MDDTAVSDSLEAVIPWPGPGHMRRLATFAAIGGISTAAFVLLYAALREITAPLAANAAALTLTMGANFLANRRYTFQVRGGPLLTHAAQYLVTYGLGVAGSTVALGIGLAIAQDPGRIVETGIALVSGLVATAIRYTLLATWVFRRPGDHRTNALEASR